MKPSSLCFSKCVENALAFRRCDGVDFGGFSNAVLEYIFSLPRSDRGMVDNVVYSYGVETEHGLAHRIARFMVKIEGMHHFLYVFAEASTCALQEWRVTGRSVLMSGVIRMPDYETEMIWL